MRRTGIGPLVASLPVAIALAAIWLASCSRRSSPPSSSETPDSPAVDAVSMPLSASDASSDRGPSPDAPIEAGPAPPGEADASPEAREQAVLALLSGGDPATGLPTVAVEPGRPFSPFLRDRVAPRVLVDGGGYYLRSGMQMRLEPPTVTGKDLPPEVVQRIVRQNFGRFRLCYENGLRDNPALAGKVTVQLAVAKDGSVDSAKVQHATLQNDAVVQCIRRGLTNLSFPELEHGPATVTCSIVFSRPE